MLSVMKILALLREKESLKGGEWQGDIYYDTQAESGMSFGCMWKTSLTKDITNSSAVNERYRGCIHKALASRPT